MTIVFPSAVLEAATVSKCGKKLKRHILKRNCRPVKQLQIIGAVCIHQRGDLRRIKFGIISPLNTGL